jgi:hypothetical protein
MGMEKRGSTSQHDVRELVKLANAEEKIFVISLDGFIKAANGKLKPAVVVVATGDRATMLREFVEKVSD